MDEKPEVLTTTEARSGVGTHVVRYVLVISVVLAVAAMAWVYLQAPAPTQQGATTGAKP